MRRLGSILTAGFAASLLVAVGCSNKGGAAPATVPPAQAAQSVASAVAAASAANAYGPAAEASAAPRQGARIGSLAPDFKLNDLDGHPVSLSSLRGRTVVLEWFNPSCPFVNAAHLKGSLKDAARKHAATGVMWLAINSGAAGKPGYEVDANRAAVTRFGLQHPVLRDENGAVGHAYGATNTPSIYVVDPAGVLVYAGAVDNSPDAEGESPAGGTLVRYVDETLADLAAHKPVRTPETKPYGCSVKYGS